MDWKEILYRKRYLTDNQKYGLKMLCFQMAYLSINLLYFYIAWKISLVYEGMNIDLVAIYLCPRNSEFWVALMAAAYPVVSSFSFFTFLWASATGKLRHKTVKRIYNFPPILFAATVIFIIMGALAPSGGGINQMG